jgi:hypothetical protein
MLLSCNLFFSQNIHDARAQLVNEHVQIVVRSEFTASVSAWFRRMPDLSSDFAGTNHHVKVLIPGNAWHNARGNVPSVFFPACGHLDMLLERSIRRHDWGEW